MPATGYRFGDIAYLTDCSRIPAESVPLLGNLRLLIIDALRYTPHANHFNIAGAVDVVTKLRPERAIFTHLTHEVPYREGVMLPAGVEFAYDGMRLE